jgi:hypothetical protein
LQQLIAAEDAARVVQEPAQQPCFLLREADLAAIVMDAQQQSGTILPGSTAIGVGSFLGPPWRSRTQPAREALHLEQDLIRVTGLDEEIIRAGA